MVKQQAITTTTNSEDGSGIHNKILKQQTPNIILDFTRES